jgi:CRISPR/Cas system endoribonuclease Cas6 (RAMP superfamily)
MNYKNEKFQQLFKQILLLQYKAFEKNQEDAKDFKLLMSLNKRLLRLFNIGTLKRIYILQIYLILDNLHPIACFYT